MPRARGEVLRYVGVSERRHDDAASYLSYGDQRRVEIARALASDPKLLLLDEPTAGMNPQETRQAEELIFKIRDQGLAIVVIEHDMRFIFNLCDRVLCLVRGEALVEIHTEDCDVGNVAVPRTFSGHEMMNDTRRPPPPVYVLYVGKGVLQTCPHPLG